MSTTIRPNGKPGHSEIVWPDWLKWIATILSTLIVAGVLGTIALYAEVRVLSAEVRAATLVLETHVADRRLHEDADTKRDRIRDEIDRYHGSGSSQQ